MLGVAESKKKEGVKRFPTKWLAIQANETPARGVGLIIEPNKMKDIIREEHINENEMKIMQEETWIIIIMKL